MFLKGKRADREIPGSDSDAGELQSVNQEPALECTGLVKGFGQTPVLNGLNLSLQQGHVLSLLGPSGCGKTTTLRVIAGFEQPDRGTVKVNGQIVGGAGRHVPPENRKVGIVLQEGALFPHMSVEQNIAFGLSKDPQMEERIREVLDLGGIENLRRRMPHELSGGQHQRVALARALAPRPKVLLLDEPFSNLDPRLREQVRKDVLRMLKESQVSTVFVTHDQEEALLLGDEISVMNHGQIEQSDRPEMIFHRPATRFVAEFMGIADFLPAWRNGDTVMTDVGPIDWPQPNPEGELEVMVRPDCLVCRPSDEGQGIITDREFRGPFYLYQVSLPSGSSVRCLLTHTRAYPVGTPVEIALRDGHTLTPFAGRMAVSEVHHHHP